MNKYFITDLCVGLKKIKVLVQLISKEEYAEELHLSKEESVGLLYDDPDAKAKYDDPDAQAMYNAICELIRKKECAKIYGAIRIKDDSKEVIESLLQKVVLLHISDDAKEFNNLEEAEKAFEEWKEN